MQFEVDTLDRPSILDLQPSSSGSRHITIMTQESAVEKLGAHGAGGASLTALRTTSGLNELGFSTALITPLPRTPDGKLPYDTYYYDLSELATQALGTNVDPDTLSSDTLLEIYSRPEVAERLGDTIESGDLLHAHFYTTKGLLEHLPQETPVIYYHHSPFTRVRKLYDPSMRGEHASAAKASITRVDAEHWLLTHTDAVVVFTKAEAELIKQQYPEIDLEGRLHVVPLGIDMNIFNPDVKANMRQRAREEFNIPLHSKVIYMQARVGKSQGQLLLARAFKDYLMHADPNLHLVIAGGPARGEADYMEELEAIARELPNRVTLTGPLSPQVGHAIGDISVGFKLETFGFSNLEAMAVGNGLIVQDNPIHREVYGSQNGVGYLNLDKLDQPDQQALFLRMINDPQFVANAAVNNPRQAGRYPWTRTRATLARLTSEVLDRPGGTMREYHRRTEAEMHDLIVEKNGKRYKVIGFTDYDGTAANQLLPEAQRLGSTGKARATLQTLKAKGIPTGVITSRSLGEAIQISDVLAAKGISIAENGAVIEMPVGISYEGIPGVQMFEGKPVAVLSTVTTDTLKEFLKIVENQAKRLDPASTSLISSFSPAHDLQKAAKHHSMEDTIASTNRLGSAYAVKLTPTQQALIHDLAPQYGIHAMFDGTTVNLEGADVSKGNALRFIQKHAKQLFPQDNIDGVVFIGFGNHSNDIPLWSAAIESGGVGIMVAHPEGNYFINPSVVPAEVVKTTQATGYGMEEALPTIFHLLEERYGVILS